MATCYDDTRTAASYAPPMLISQRTQQNSTSYVSHPCSNQVLKSDKDCTELYRFRQHQFDTPHALTPESNFVRKTISSAITVASNSACRQQPSQLSSHSGSSADCSIGIKSFNHHSPMMMGFEPPVNHIQNWEENSPRAETSGSMDEDGGDEKHISGNRGEIVIASRSSDLERAKGTTDSKVLRRLAQNREAARKSRLRKKAYVQQLESSRVKLNQIEQELDRARQQGVHGAAHSGDASRAATSAFNMDYARWVEEQNRLLSALRSSLTGQAGENELRQLVDKHMAHYEDLFRLKGTAIKADVFHIVSGMWKSPAERCFMWMGGFRPSELLKVILIPQLEPLSEQQLLAVCNLQQSSQQAEDALSQGMEALQQNLADTLSNGSLGASHVANYMSQMATAMGKLSTLENFVRQADNLRQQTLQQMHRILTTRQAARGLLAMGDYFSRLRALSSLWIARPRD
ncbi:hypothetical protein KP509_21G055300 [Ceratopteris richardii]|uniref:Uncharacterized protein n=1 Tax=Ceratopteris richardii TaxID=49495 RepID=A0A8T2SC03_CERRI|nr:hypothetical protein KP509_21G055300 [Ceratopteris richardii]